jgi:hypothetical protein
MRPQAVGLIAFSQLVDEMLEIGRCPGSIRAKHLLKALTHRLADRSTGLVIERLDVVYVWIFHDRFRALTIHMIR